MKPRPIVLVLLILLSLALFILPATSHEGHPPSEHNPPADPAPVGERDPVVGTLAFLSIVVAGVAGLWVYRVIRRGL